MSVKERMKMRQTQREGKIREIEDERGKENENERETEYERGKEKKRKRDNEIEKGKIL